MKVSQANILIERISLLHKRHKIIPGIHRQSRYPNAYRGGFGCFALVSSSPIKTRCLFL